VIRPALRDGEVNFSGEFYTAKAKFTTAPDTPVLISALREHAFEMAGELSDGGISWVTPVDYLVSTSLAALERGARSAGRPTPPLIAHTFISARTDRAMVRKAVKANLAYYVEAPFYQRMFAAAGYPLGPGNEISDAAIDALTISGDAGEIREQIHSRLDSGIGELLLDVVPMGTNQVAEEDAVFKIVRAL
jgi:hypothetical protein